MSTELPRRSVLKTAAWSVPVVVVATASPAFAVSPDPVRTPAPTDRSAWTSVGGGMRQVGAWGYINWIGGIFFDSYTEGGDLEPAGTYWSGPMTYTMTWGIPNNGGPYQIEGGGGGGWVVQSLSEPGPTGALVMTFPQGILNGVAYEITAPSPMLSPAGGDGTDFTMTLSSDYVPARSSSQRLLTYEEWAGPF